MLIQPTNSAHDSAVHAALRDQLAATLPPAARISAHGWRPWASASFAGARHWFDLAPGNSDLSPLRDSGWSEREWTLAGSFVADVALMPDEPDVRDWRIEFLTVDD
jgi:hypothetical protein